MAPRAAIVALALAFLTWGVARVVTPGERTGPSGAERAAAAPTKSAGLGRLEALPLQGQSVISTTLGANAPEFAAQRDAGGYRLRGGGVSAAFRARGVTLSAGAASLSFVSPTIGHGGRLGPSGSSSISARGNRVAYRRGALTAWYAAGPLGIEQGFNIRERPAGSAHELTVALGLSTTLRARRSASGLEFLTRSGQVAMRYGALVATDAHGRRLPATLAVRGGKLLLGVADAGAVYPLRIDPLIQTGNKVTPADEFGAGGSYFGWSIALSADGTTALVGGPQDNTNVGAAWVYTDSGGSWSEQAKLLAPTSGVNQEDGGAFFGTSVALSADGNSALIGGPYDNTNVGAAWAYVRSGSSWGAPTKLLAPTSGVNQESGEAYFGDSVSLSSDGTTALIGGNADDTNVGAAWVFTGSGTSLMVQDKLIAPTSGANMELGAAQFGNNVVLAGDGTTAVIGGQYDNTSVGAAWVFNGSGSSWGTPVKLTAPTSGPDAESGPARFGFLNALSTNGDTALIGGPLDNGGVGAVWVYGGSGTSLTEQAKLTAPTSGPDAESGDAYFGAATALSSNGTMALIGGYADSSNAGAAWAYAGAGSSWAEHAKLVAPISGGSAESGAGDFGSLVALSSDGTESLIAGLSDASNNGAVWVSTPVDGFSFNPNPVVFGSSADGVDVGSSTAEQLTVTNSGYTPRVLGTVSLSGSQASFSLSSDGCSGQTLAAGSSCALTVNFHPGAVGTFGAQINVPDNAPNSPDVVSVSGFAAVAPIAAPVLRESADVAPAGGTVLVKLVGSSVFEPLSVAENVPMGSTIDATNGTAAITTALPDGTTQTGDFYDGEFVVTQAANGRVTVTLTGGSFKGCPVAQERKKHKKSQVHFAAAKKSATTVVRKLWGNAHGDYTTSARSASASVLGTIWLTEDRCDGSYFKVTKDTVAVTAFAHPKKVHHLKQGQSILIAARGF
jgi:hypothetical protein